MVKLIGRASSASVLQVGRRLGLSERELSRQAFQAAIDDAGMQASDIDGITAMGGGMSMDIAYTLG
jgi:hypothetical protein